MTCTKKIKIAITSTIIAIFAVASTSNVYAYDITTSVVPTGSAWEWGANTVWGYWNNGSNLTRNGSSIFLPAPSGDINKPVAITYISSANAVVLKKGNYYGFTISFTAEANQVQGGTDNTGKGIALPGFNRMASNNVPWKLMSIQENTNNCGWWKEPIGGAGQTTVTYMATGCAYGNISYNIVMQATSDYTGSVKIGDTGQYMFNWLAYPGGTGNYGTATAGVITEFREQKTDSINQEQQQAGEQAQSDGQTAGSGAQTDAQTGSASLLQGAGSIIGALTDTQASDCSINLNMGNLDLGTQNFCQGDIGPIRPVIATITNVLFAFVSFRVFSFLIGVMFGLFDEFFGTKTERGGA